MENKEKQTLEIFTRTYFHYVTLGNNCTEKTSERLKMAFSICSIASGSNGNCYHIKTETTSLLVDAGISATRIVNGLNRCGTDPDKVNALFITHEHSDHISGLGAIANRISNLQIFANRGTFSEIKSQIARERREVFDTGEEMAVGDIKIQSFAVSHDTVDPVGYSFIHEGKMISIVTDTGVFTEEILSATADADILAIESNYDSKMLKNGRYPIFLKQRIMSTEGHLSNEQTGDAINEIMSIEKKPRCILLAHLSEENNRPQLAEKTVTEKLMEMDRYLGRDYYLKPLLRDRMSAILEI